jgi:hypothetical protein
MNDFFTLALRLENWISMVCPVSICFYFTIGMDKRKAMCERIHHFFFLVEMERETGILKERGVLMAKLRFEGMGNIHALGDELKIRFPHSGVSCLLVDEAHNANDDTILLVFDKYYMRVENRVSLSVMIYPYQNRTKVEIIGSGGGKSLFFRYNWGSETSLIRSMGRLLMELGFWEVV